LGRINKNKKKREAYDRYLGDRLKHRQGLMLAGILGLLGSTLLFMLGRLYWELLLARFLQGFSDACVWTLGMCLISDTFPLEELGTQVKKSEAA
jgi:MFS family permease